MFGIYVCALPRRCKVLKWKIKSAISALKCICTISLWGLNWWTCLMLCLPNRCQRDSVQLQRYHQAGTAWDVLYSVLVQVRRTQWSDIGGKISFCLAWMDWGMFWIHDNYEGGIWSHFAQQKQLCNLLNLIFYIFQARWHILKTALNGEFYFTPLWLTWSPGSINQTSWCSAFLKFSHTQAFGSDEHFSHWALHQWGTDKARNILSFSFFLGENKLGKGW